jgi:sulfate permease, SulP family
LPSSAPSPTLPRLRMRRPTWLSPKVARVEILAGLVVALALIPEAISFSIIAGVDPSVGLFASFTMAVTIAFVGGRPAMISAATGAVALVIAPLNHDHGLGYLIAAVVLGGVFQIILGALGVAKLMRFVPRSVMVGFVNALAILIFIAQVPQLHDVPWAVYPLVVAALAILVFFPRLTKVVPAPLVSIVRSPRSPWVRASPYPTSAAKASSRRPSPPPACRTCPSPWTRSPPSRPTPSRSRWSA